MIHYVQGVHMIGQSQFTDVIEHLRLQKKLTYQTFLEDIVSERSYRRYVNKGKPFNFEVLVLLVDRLQMRMRDFIIFSLNHISIKHQQEIYLSHYLDHGMYEEAKTLLDSVKPPFYTHVGTVILPSLLKRYAYLHHHIDKYEYIHFLKNQIEFEQLKSRKIIDRNSVKVLLLLLQDGTFEDQNQVVPILFDLMFGHKQLITQQYDIDMNAIIQTLAHELFSNERLKETFSSQIDQTFLYAMENVKKYHLDDGLISFFTDALHYIQKEDLLFANYVLYYLMIKRLHNMNYHAKDDVFLSNLLPVDELKTILLNTSLKSLHFMKVGDI